MKSDPTGPEKGQLKCADLGLRVGNLPRGTLNAITDVPGVRVGHVTVDLPDRDIHSGFTAVVPAIVEGSPTLPAAAHVINGHGKPTGFAQINELGTIETPVLLANTFAVGTGYQAVIKYMLEKNPGLRTGFRSLNPVVAECNDSALSNMQALALTTAHAYAALDAAAEGPVDQGAVGAGRGMTLFDLKGGIGTASRTVVDGRYVVGVIALANFGRLSDLTICGRPVGRVLAAERDAGGPGEREPLAPGSVVVVVATDAPALDRLLGRMLRRAQTGLGRVGGSVAHGSGEFAIGFSTKAQQDLQNVDLREMAVLESTGGVDEFFDAVIESTEEAVLNCLMNAKSLRGRDGTTRSSFPVERLQELLDVAGKLDHQAAGHA